jgi:uncharacterized protein YfbU (UPF0304 family)
MTPWDKEASMSRIVKPRSRKTRSLDAHARVLRGMDVEKLRRYLAFVRAVVGVSTRSAAPQARKSAAR